MHARQLVHRDVNPTNILIEHGTGRLVLLDLGVARDLASTTVTTAVIVGTPTFMAPEQVRGEPVTPRTDVYQLGATVHTLLAGRPPFVGEPFQVMDAVLYAALPDLGALRPDLPPAVVAAVAEAIAKDPTRRPPDARAFAAALRAGAAGPIPGTPATHAVDEAATQRVSPRAVPTPAPIVTGHLQARGRRTLPLALLGGGAAAALVLGAMAVAGRGDGDAQARAVTPPAMASVPETPRLSPTLAPTPPPTPTPNTPAPPQRMASPTAALAPTALPTRTPSPPTPAPGTPVPNPAALAATMRRLCPV